MYILFHSFKLIASDSFVLYELSGPQRLLCDGKPQSLILTYSSILIETCHAQSGQWKCDKRHGQGICLFADGTRFRGEWEEDAWLQSAADPTLCKVSGLGLAKALAGQTASFAIQVMSCHAMCHAMPPA